MLVIHVSITLTYEAHIKHESPTMTIILVSPHHIENALSPKP